MLHGRSSTRGRCIVCQAGYVADPELGSYIGDCIRRHVSWLGQEDAKDTNGRQLDGEAQLVVRATPLAEPFVVSVIQVEKTSQLLGLMAAQHSGRTSAPARR
jgi:hypothetical protein